MRLTDFVCPDAAAFDVAAKLAAWAELQRYRPSPEHDRLATDAFDQDKGRAFGLILHLSTVDSQFFELSKRMAARDLMRREPSPVVRRIAAELLVSSPQVSKSKVKARNLLLVLGVAVGHASGLTKFEGEKPEAKLSSAVGLLTERIRQNGAAVSFSTVEGAVKKGKVRDILVGTGFGSDDISEIIQNLFQ